MARGRTAEEIQEASPVLLEAAVDNRFFRRNEARTLPAFGGGAWVFISWAWWAVSLAWGF